MRAKEYERERGKPGFRPGGPRPRPSSGSGGTKWGATCSFDEDTLVLTDQGYLRIADIEPGTRVWAQDDLTNESGWKPVLAAGVADYDETVYLTIRDIETGDEQTITSNRIHPFFTGVEAMNVLVSVAA